jgi:hypothetical protein
MGGKEKSILQRVLDAVRDAAPHGVVVFDLDSTLLDNRPRQVRIFHDFAAQHGIAELAAAEPHHWLGWDLRVPLRNLGLDDSRIASIYPQIKDFWRERFFTSEYCVDDIPVPGAPAYVTELSHSGAQVAYLTGRHEGMRAGTIETLRSHGFPVPPGNGQPVYLLMKPNVEEEDDAFKAAAHTRVRVLGPVIAAFDNEPLHANDLAKSFPDAIVVHLDTDHSGRQVALALGIPSISDFR